ncbi:MAG: hypothetical protein R3F65_01225 [bacterium]
MALRPPRPPPTAPRAPASTPHRPRPPPPWHGTPNTPSSPSPTAPPPEALAALLTATPAIARLRVEVHDYRDPYAGHYGKCRPCARAAVLADAITRHGIDPARITHAGHHLDRLPHDRPREAALAPGPKRYEVHIERWHHPP